MTINKFWRGPRLVLLLVVLSVAWLQALSDNDSFTYSNGELGSVSGGAWANATLVGSGFTLDVSSNVVVPSFITNNVYYRTAGSWAADGYSQLTLVQATPTSAYGGPCVRISGTGGSAVGYCLITDTTGGNYCGIQKFAGNSFSNLDSGGTSCTQPAAGSVLKLDISGTSLTAYDDGASFSTGTDNDYSSGVPGMYGYGTNAQLDDWSAADAGGASSAPCTRMLLGVGCHADAAFAQWYGRLRHELPEKVGAR